MTRWEPIERLLSLACAVLLAVMINLGAASNARAGFLYDPILEPIMSASFNADFAALTAHRFIAGTEVNTVILTGSGGAMVDLSDAFYGTSELLNGDTPLIDQGPTETGVFSVSIPTSFFPALGFGHVGISFLATDTGDGVFAIDYLSLRIETASGTVESFIDENDGFGIGLPDGDTLPLPLPDGLGVSGTGFDEPIASKAHNNEIPAPSSAALLAIGLVGLAVHARAPLRRLRLMAACVAALLAPQAHALVVAMDIEEMSLQAGWIVDATVEEVRSEPSADGAQAYTFVTLRVERYRKGASLGSVLTLRMLGGQTSDIGMVVAEQPVFVADQRVVLFIDENPQTLFPIVGMDQGAFLISSDAGSEPVATSAAGVSLTQAELESRIAAALSGSP